MLKDVQAIADTVGALLASEYRGLQAHDSSAPLQPRGFHVNVRPDDNGAVDEEQQLRPAVVALAQMLSRFKVATFQPLELPPPHTCESASADGPIPVRVIRHLQVLPDPIYKFDADDNVMYDDDGDPIWDDEAMSQQTVPFWRVRIDVLGEA